MSPTSDSLVAAQARVGTSLRGKLLLERLLGVGAMAAVYEATHRNGAHVAVKVLHREVGTISELRRRFLREGYIANRIPHPGVVRVLDDDEDADGTAFTVMELLPGKTLETEWQERGRQLPLERVIAIADALLNVLDAAHAAGVVHRDVKPDNIFLTTDGALKVLDFGIARLVESASMTHTGQVMGTPEFTSPEQAAGNVREIDARTDLFATGAVMFTLLSGETVHRARSAMEYLVYAATNQARPLRDAVPGIDPLFARVVDRALTFDKAGRWSSAREMQSELRRAAEELAPTLVGEVLGHLVATRQPVVARTSTLQLPSSSTLAFPLVTKEANE